MKIHSKTIEMVPIETIIPNPKNRNIHPPGQIERLAKIIEFSGFREPLIISNRSGFLIAGHGRLQAAKLIGMKEVPVIRQDFDSEAIEYQHMIADNEIARWAKLDTEGIKADLVELDLEFNVDFLGLESIEFLKTDFLDEKDSEKEITEEEVKKSSKIINCPNCGEEICQ